MRLSQVMLVVLALGVVACTGPSVRPAVAPDAQALRQRLGLADTIAASLLIRIQPAQGDGELFTLRLWADVTGTVRLRAQKLDVDVLDAVVQADGSYRALLVREHVATAGTLGGPDDPALLDDVRMLLDELRYGPVPAAVVVTGGADTWSWRDPSGAEVVLGLAPDGLPTSKRLSTAGAILRSLDYARWQAFDELQRPSQVTLRSAGDGDVTTIRIKSLDTPPAISAERMALRLPEGTAQVDVAEFSRRLMP